MAQLDDMLARLLADQHFIKVYTFTPRTYGQREKLPVLTGNVG